MQPSQVLIWTQNSINFQTKKRGWRSWSPAWSCYCRNQTTQGYRIKYRVCCSQCQLVVLYFQFYLHTFLQITWCSMTNWSKPCCNDDKRRKDASCKRKCDETERRTIKTAKKVVWLSFHISWMKYTKIIYGFVIKLLPSATSKGLMYRRGMHGVYIAHVYILKCIPNCIDVEQVLSKKRNSMLSSCKMPPTKYDVIFLV